ncbi:MAG: FprA family A-type flavoprotein [Phycisphaerales bacterium]|nr:MAG: FprA family A-type flavoprotein [Phycisphaerales bacterium]
MNTTLCENIDWVGYVDWTVRDFHGYSTDRGATYNAYLIRDDKTALIDTVKAPFAEQLLQNIAGLTDPAKVDYVVCNHAEPDHAGAMAKVMEALPNATLVCDKKCEAALGMHHDSSGWKTHIVATGDTLSLGKRTLEFIETPMVHWPESMFTYVPEEKLLFSMDAFGQHYATSQRFDDEVQLCTAMEEAKTYYANIIMPFSKMVAATLDRAAKLDIEMIAPSHGVVWRSHITEIVEAYGNWACCRPKPKVLVIYDTMWGATGEMAAAIHEGASQAGVTAELINVRTSNLTKIATEVLDAACVAFGSSTLNQDALPMASAVLTYLKGLKPVDKAALAFGSYGWSKGGAEAADEKMKAMKWEILREPIRAQYEPNAEVLTECRAAGKLLAAKAKEMASDRKAGGKLCVDP